MALVVILLALVAAFGLKITTLQTSTSSRAADIHINDGQCGVTGGVCCQSRTAPCLQSGAVCRNLRCVAVGVLTPTSAPTPLITSKVTPTPNLTCGNAYQQCCNQKTCNDQNLECRILEVGTRRDPYQAHICVWKANVTVQDLFPCVNNVKCMGKCTTLVDYYAKAYPKDVRAYTLVHEKIEKILGYSTICVQPPKVQPF